MESAALMRRYLGLLGVPERTPSLDALGEILRAHLHTVPFENVSKLYHRHVRRRRDLVDLATFVEDAERFRFGGTCYALNYGLCRLLEWLGYSVRICGAEMSRPDVHLVVIAALDGREFLLDAGYGGPFFDPVPLDGAGRTFEMGRDRYEFSSDAGRPALEHYRNGELRHRYLVDPRARSIDEFREVIAASFDDDATFMNALLVIRSRPGSAETLANMRFFETRGAETSTRMLSHRTEVVELLAQRFGMPRSVVEELIADLPMRRDPGS